MTEKKTVLIVEDNPINMELASDLLEIHGWEVLQAEDAIIGIEIAKSRKPDLILMDIQLPGMDGMTATRHLKGDPETKHLKIVAFTSYAMRSDYENAMESGFDGYITKPIDTRKFPHEVLLYL